MDFLFTEDQKMLRTMVRDFADKELEPIAARIDEEASFPAESIKKAADIGLMGTGFPEEYGGSGGGALEQAIIFEEVARVCASTSVILIVTNELTSYPIYTFGTEEQKQQFLVPLARGEKLGAFGLTEASAGSDVASMETTATRQNGGYTLNGNKLFITNGAEAEILVQGAFEKALAYAQERQQFGQPIAGFQAIQWMLADMATQIDAARLLTHRAAYLKDSGLPFMKESSMAKVFAAEAAMFVTSKAIQIHGGYGYIKDYPLERYFRDAKITEIYEGTSEMQRMTIARQLLRGE